MPMIAVTAAAGTFADKPALTKAPAEFGDRGHRSEDPRRPLSRLWRGWIGSHRDSVNQLQREHCNGYADPA